MGTIKHQTDWLLNDQEVTSGTPVLTGWVADADSAAMALWLEGSGAATVSIDAQYSPVQPNDRKRSAADSYQEVAWSADAAYDEWLAAPSGEPASFGQVRFKVSATATITISLALARKTQ